MHRYFINNIFRPKVFNNLKCSKSKTAIGLIPGFPVKVKIYLTNRSVKSLKQNNILCRTLIRGANVGIVCCAQLSARFCPAR